MVDTASLSVCPEANQWSHPATAPKAFNQGPCRHRALNQSGHCRHDTPSPRGDCKEVQPHTAALLTCRRLQHLLKALILHSVPLFILPRPGPSIFTPETPPLPDNIQQHPAAILEKVKQTASNQYSYPNIPLQVTSTVMLLTLCM